MSRPLPLARVALPIFVSLMSITTLAPSGPVAAQQVTADTVLIPVVEWSAAPPAPSLPFPPASRRPVASSILGGTLGSGAGLVGGAFVGYAMRSCSSGEWFCGLGEAFLGAMVGSAVGSALGANIAARHGGASPTFRSTLVGGALGILSGVAGSYLMAQVAPEGPAPLVGFSVGQGIVTGLFAARRR